MIDIKGFQNCSVYIFDSSYNLIHDYTKTAKKILVPIYKEQKNYKYFNQEAKTFDIEKCIKENSDIENLKIGEQVYIEKECLIPRTNLGDKFKRCVNRENASHIVVPTKLKCEIKAGQASIFVDKESKNVFVLFNSNVKASVGDKIFECIERPSKISVDYNDISNELLDALERATKCAVPEDMIIINLNRKDENVEWILDVLDGDSKKFVNEFELYDKLVDDDEDIYDSIEGIMDLLGSSSDESVGLGLKMISNLNFSKYRNVFIEMLCQTKEKWQLHKTRDSVNVKFMLNYLFGGNVDSTNNEVDLRSKMTPFRKAEYEIIKDFFIEKTYSLRLYKRFRDYEEQQQMVKE